METACGAGGVDTADGAGAAAHRARVLPAHVRVAPGPPPPGHLLRAQLCAPALAARHGELRYPCAVSCPGAPFSLLDHAAGARQHIKILVHAILRAVNCAAGLPDGHRQLPVHCAWRPPARYCRASLLSLKMLLAYADASLWFLDVTVRSMLSIIKN